MNTSELIKKFNRGNTLTNSELLDLYGELCQIEDILIGQGDMFYPTRLFTSNINQTVRRVCKERGLI